METKTYKELLPEITLKYKKGIEQMVQISSSRDGYNMFMKFYDQDTIELTESCVCLFLNTRNKTIGWLKVSSGGMTETIVDIRLVLGTALKCGATGIMLSHNHPSGYVQPSPCDNNVTQKLNSACKTMDIRLLDHIIMGEDGNYFSYADEGII